MTKSNVPLAVCSDAAHHNDNFAGFARRFQSRHRKIPQERKSVAQLDGLRGFSAAFVFLHHAKLFPKSGPGVIFFFGQEAVILFFLLSGFVIYYSTRVTATLPVSVRTYLIHRVRRIYPVLIFALAIAYFCASLRADRLIDPEISAAFENLAMLQDVASLKRGVWVDTYMGDSPLWSLSYEWWFYLLFIPLGLVPLVAGKWRQYLVAVISLAGFLSYQYLPNQISLFGSYFIIWWAGVELARQYGAERDVTFAGQSTTILLLLLAAALWFVPVWLAHRHGDGLSLGVDPVLQFRHFGAAALLLLCGICWHKLGWPLFGATIGRFRVLAPISYSLYLIHVPVLSVVENSCPQLPPAMRALITIVVVVPVCYLLEVRLQKRVNDLTNRMLIRNHGAASTVSKEPGAV